MMRQLSDRVHVLETEVARLERAAERRKQEIYAERERNGGRRVWDWTDLLSSNDR